MVGFGQGHAFLQGKTMSLRRYLAFIVWVGAGVPVSAEKIVVEQKTIDTLDAATRDRFIAVDRQVGGIRLARSYLITNETGVTGKCFDRLGDSGYAKIRFDIPIPDFEKGLLLVYNSYTFKGNPPKTVAVNGRPRDYVHDEARMLTGGWARHDIPAAELKVGANEVVIGGAGGLHVDTFSGSGKCSRSFDAGKTWKSNALGPEGQWSGDYIVRLRVYGYAPAGQVISPVIDPAVVPRDPGIRSEVRVRSVVLRAEQDAPTGTGVVYSLRSGSTPSVRGRTWSDWQPIGPGQPMPVPSHRYLQWRARLATDSSRQTPVVRSVCLDLDAEVVPARLGGLHVEAFDNPRIAETSYPFEWESDTPRIRHLREKHRLEEVVRASSDELTRQMLVRKWVSQRWDKGWDLGKYHYVPAWDALELLELAPQHLSLGMCTHYSCTFVQCAAAMGYNTRSLIVDHHCIAEVWSNTLGKWVLQDTGPGPGPKGFPVSFAYQADGRWLNALEVHRALAERRSVTAVPLQDLKDPYTLNDDWMKLFVRFGIPLRNNHLSQPAPAELEHGHEHYRWDGYLWWTESVDDPRYPEYSLLSNRVADFYYPLQQVAVDLRQRDADTLTVHPDTMTPNLAGYEIQLDEGPWTSASDGFDWRLHAGGNRLAIRSVNVFGIRGRPTVIAIRKDS